MNSGTGPALRAPGRKRSVCRLVSRLKPAVYLKTAYGREGPFTGLAAEQTGRLRPGNQACE